MLVLATKKSPACAIDIIKTWVFSTLLLLPVSATYGTDETISIQVHNLCTEDKTFGIFQIAAYQMQRISMPVLIPRNHHANLTADIKSKGLRLSATAEEDLKAQWRHQALFEFGYSTYKGKEGTAYDISIMEGSSPNIGIQVKPDNSLCATKICSPKNCPPSQGWTNENQTQLGSPADAVCYESNTGFRVKFFSI